MTPRGVLVAALPVSAVALGGPWPVALWGGLLLLLAALAAIIIDAVRAPGPGRLTAVRTHEAVLSVGVPNPVSVEIGCRRGTTVALVHDEFPAHMDSDHVPGRLRLPGIVNYSVTPRSRGERSFGRTVIRAPGPWGIGFRQTSLTGAGAVHVDADITALRTFDALARRGRLTELGVRALRGLGQGTEFERLREAVPDDPPRAINWRATARTGRLMAAELVPERAQPVIICIDHGRLMGVGAGALTKLDHAINSALLLIHVVLGSGDRAGLLSFSDHVTSAVAARSGRIQIRRFVDAVRPLQAADTEADYDQAFTYLSSWQPKRALLVIFTDVLDRDQGWTLVQQCSRLRRRHLPLVVTFRDPAVEAAAQCLPIDPAAVYRRAVASGLIAERDDTLRALRRSGVETIDAQAAVLSPRLINRYLELKARARL